MARDGYDAPAIGIHDEEADNRPLEEQIAALAHALWHERGCPDGTPEEDWFSAEQQIMSAGQK
jgi:hypothetical protein